jgi:serine/threonine-protein kinase
MTLWCFGFLRRGEALPRARDAAEQAVELDGRLAPAHTALGMVNLADWKWAEAEKEFLYAVALSPESPSARHWHALYLAAMGRHGVAIEQSERAVALDPSPSFRVGLGAILYFAHDFARMARVLEETVAAAPDSAPAFDWLGMAYIQLGRFDESIEAYRKAVALSDGTAEIMAGLGHAYGIAGRMNEARKVLGELDAAAEQWYVPPVQIAYVCAGLSDDNRTFQLLEQAFEERSWELVFLREEPWFDHLRGNPRFTDLVDRMKFPPRG